MNSRQTVLVSAATLALGILGAPATAADIPYQGEGHVMVVPKDLEWSDVPSMAPGAKIAVIEGNLKESEPITFRLRLPANYEIPVHTHPAYERVTVLSGTLHFGAGKEPDPAKAKALPEGSVAIMPPGTPMFAYTGAEETEIQVHGMGPWGIEYLNPADDPRKREVSEQSREKTGSR